MSLTHLLWIGLGGACGTMGRALLGHYLAHPFPWATLVVNVAGSFLLGLLAGFELTRVGFHPSARDFFTIGFCGGFTTFSTFGLQTLQQFEAGHTGAAFLNMVASLAGALVAVWLGLKLGRAFAVS